MKLRKTIITLTALSLIMTLTGCWEREKGEKIGNIVKLAKEGAFIKTNECELIRGGMNNGSGSFGSKPFDFTIEDDKLLAIAQKALDEQKSVRIKYHKEFTSWARTETNDNSFLDDIEIIN
jgi:hypothetical protein